MKKTLLLRLSLGLNLGLGALLLVPGFVLAEDQEENAPEYADVDVPAPPDLPDPVESGQALAPEVTIIHKDDATITEYRINGNLYKVKVVPFVGRPYYLIDRDGDGVMEGRSSIYDDIIVPQWVLFSW
jgi:hypothetical protein